MDHLKIVPQLWARQRRKEGTPGGRDTLVAALSSHTTTLRPAGDGESTLVPAIFRWAREEAASPRLSPNGRGRERPHPDPLLATASLRPAGEGGNALTPALAQRARERRRGESQKPEEPGSGTTRLATGGRWAGRRRAAFAVAFHHELGRLMSLAVVICVRLREGLLVVELPRSCK